MCAAAIFRVVLTPTLNVYAMSQKQLYLISGDQSYGVFDVALQPQPILE